MPDSIIQTTVYLICCGTGIEKIIHSHVLW